MTVKIFRRPQATRDVEEIADFIANDSLDSALRFLINAEETTRHLADFPDSGSAFATKEPRLRGLQAFRVTGFPNHVVFFLNHGDKIEIVRVMHGARAFESELLKDE